MSQAAKLHADHPLPVEVEHTVSLGDEDNQTRRFAAHIALLSLDGYQPAGEYRRVVRDGHTSPHNEFTGVAVHVPRSEWPAELANGSLAPGPALIGVVLKRGRRGWEMVFPLEMDGQVFTYSAARLQELLPVPSPAPASSAAEAAAPAAAVVAPLGTPGPAVAADGGPPAAPLGGAMANRLAVVSIAVLGLGVGIGAHDSVAEATLRRFAAHKLGVAALEHVRILRVTKTCHVAPGRHPDVVVAEVTVTDKVAIWRAKCKLGPDCAVSFALHHDNTLGRSRHHDSQEAMVPLHAFVDFLRSQGIPLEVPPYTTARGPPLRHALSSRPPPPPPPPAPCRLNISAPAYVPAAQTPALDPLCPGPTPLGPALAPARAPAIMPAPAPPAPPAPTAPPQLLSDVQGASGRAPARVPMRRRATGGCPRRVAQCACRPAAGQPSAAAEAGPSTTAAQKVAPGQSAPARQSTSAGDAGRHSRSTAPAAGPSRPQ